MLAIKDPATRWDDLRATLEGAVSAPPAPHLQGARAAFESDSGAAFDQHIQDAVELFRAIQVGQEQAATDTPWTRRLATKLTDVTNACGRMVLEASEHGYSAGYGDGWAAGALAVLRVFVEAPAPSAALADLLHLGRPTPTATDSARAAGAIERALAEK